MKAPYFIEILTGSNDVQRRHRFNSLPIRIGRGYDNDVILDDPYVSPCHAVIEEDLEGILSLRNLSSHNGILYKGRNESRYRIDGNDIFRLGHTRIRIRTSDFTVPDEITDSRWHGFEGWPPALSGLAMIVCITGTAAWMDDTEKFQALKYLITVLTVLGTGMVWCGVWAFANRLFGGSARLGRHIFILGCGFLIMEAWDRVSGLIAYALSLEIFTRYGMIIDICLFGAMIYAHLTHIKPNRTHVFAASSLAAACLGSLIILIVNYYSHGQLAGEAFMSEHFPPSLRLSPDRTVGQLMSSASLMKAKIDAERNETVSVDDTDDENEDE